MPKRVDIPAEIIERWLELRAQPHLTNAEIGLMLTQEHPNYFPSNEPKSAMAALMRNAARQGYDVPRRPTGPTPQPRLRYLREVPEVEFDHEPRLVCISDLHASAHDPAYVDRLCAVIDALGIDAAVWMGDQLDNAYKGHKGIRSRFAAPLEENVEQFAAIANRVAEAGVRRNWVIQGNHDDKPMRGTDDEITYPMWWDAHIAPALHEPEAYEVTHRYYCTMRPEIREAWPWPHKHRNFPWIFMHQAEYSKIPLRTASFHASVRFANVVCGHQHHLGSTTHESGLVLVADAGTGQHVEGPEYKVNRPTKHPQWAPGFVTIINNEPMTWRLDMAESEFERRLR